MEIDEGACLDGRIYLPFGRLGSLEKGKDANFVVFTGDVLDVRSWVDRVYIEGREAYRRDKDRELLEELEAFYAGSDVRRSDLPQHVLDRHGKSYGEVMGHLTRGNSEDVRKAAAVALSKLQASD